MSYTQAFARGAPEATAFLPADFRERSSRVVRVREAAGRGIDARLGAVLRGDRAGVEALARPGTVAVVTGQQMGLFLGPLFTLYKALTAIAVARALERESGVRAVPVFWLQTEDHDFVEIASCRLPGPHALTLAGEAARVPLAHRIFGPAIEPVLAQLAEALADLPHAAEVLALLRACYRPEATIAAAFTDALARVLPELVLLDPREPAIAALSAPVLARALTDSDAISAQLLERSAALSAAGFPPQVPVRECSPLCFYAPEGPAGARHRLDRAGDGFTVLGPGGHRTQSELLAELEREPLRFSTSALLRPLVQDALLPTAAYVAGPSELAYHAQLGPLYPQFGLRQPMLVPRASVRLVDPTTASLLRRLAFEPRDAAEPRAELLRRAAGRPAGAIEADALREQMLAPFAAQYASFEAALQAADPTLLTPARRARDNFVEAVERLSARYDRALLERDRVTCERIDRVQASLHPGGTPQERAYGWPYHAALAGPRALADAVLAALVPFTTEVHDVSLP